MENEENITKYEKCQKNFYVSENKCVARINSMGKPNCELKDDKDECECKDGFVLNP